MTPISLTTKWVCFELFFVHTYYDKIIPFIMVFDFICTYLKRLSTLSSEGWLHKSSLCILNWNNFARGCMFIRIEHTSLTRIVLVRISWSSDTRTSTLSLQRQTNQESDIKLVRWTISSVWSHCTLRPKDPKVAKGLPSGNLFEFLFNLLTCSCGIQTEDLGNWVKWHAVWDHRMTPREGGRTNKSVS